MSNTTLAAEPTTVDIHSVVKDILNTIDRERERELISRRFGLYDRKETLEQIGELLGITRERVRQLEKAVLNKLKSAGHDLPHLKEIEQRLIEELQAAGHTLRIDHLTERSMKSSDNLDKSHVAFLSAISPQLDIIDENDTYHHAVTLNDSHVAKIVKEHVNELVTTIKTHGKPEQIGTFHTKSTGHRDEAHTEALAWVSKKLATLGDDWGLKKWPTVNPKNIRDKIYVILRDNKNPMHFREISNEIKASDFKRKDVTTQAIHNELIKDKRFVLIGRGIYALNEWGYKRGTVTDVIEEILSKSDEPLHRDEIIKRVLERRQVKETTIMLNLQGKKQFKRVAKATYVLDKTAE